MPQHTNSRSNARRARWLLHKLLLWRITGAAMVVAIVIAVLVDVMERETLRDTAVDLAVQRAAQFAAVAGYALATSETTRSGEIQARLDRFVLGLIPPRDGRIVAANIYDAHGGIVARFAARDYVHGDAVITFLNKQKFSPRDPKVLWRDVEIEGAHHFFVRVPVQSAAGEVLGGLAATFAPSAAYLSELRDRLWRAVAAAVAVVLVTTAILYPVVLRLMGRVVTLSRKLLEANLEMLTVVGSAIAKNANTDLHNCRVTIYAVRLGEAVGLDKREMQSLIKGAFLHDVGKIGISDSVLLKPGRLDEKEFAQMREHVVHGVDIVRRSDWLADAAIVVGNHHEKYDGSGYGGHLKDGDIPLLARIFAIADVFDALTSKRPYKEALSCDITLSIMERERGTHFDPYLLDIFRTIAPSLCGHFVAGDPEEIRQLLRDMVTHYFLEDIEAVLI